jgi:hypothetical protein
VLTIPGLTQVQITKYGNSPGREDEGEREGRVEAGGERGGRNSVCILKKEIAEHVHIW